MHRERDADEEEGQRGVGRHASGEVGAGRIPEEQLVDAQVHMGHVLDQGEEPTEATTTPVTFATSRAFGP